MGTPKVPTPEHLRVAEMAVALVETRIRERMEGCTFCDKGPNAFQQAENAVRLAFEDVRRVFDSMRRDNARAAKQTEGS